MSATPASRSASRSVADALGNLVRWAATGQPAPMITACLTGRPHHLTSAGGDAAPSLPAWL